MGWHAILSAVLIALAFVLWPIVGNFSRTSGAWVGTMASLGTLMIVAVFSRNGLASFPPGRTIGILLIAGMINGVGVYFYSLKIANPQIPTGIFMVTTAVMMALWAPLLDLVANKAAFTTQQVFGFACAAGTIYLLNHR